MELLTGLLLTVQILVAFALIAIVLIQQTDNSGLGLAGSSGGGDAGSLLQTRASASFLTRATSILAAAFILISLAQGVLSGGYGSSGGFISNSLGLTTPAAEIDNAGLANPIVFGDTGGAGSGADTTNLRFDPNIALDAPAADAPAASETAPTTDATTESQ